MSDTAVVRNGVTEDGYERPRLTLVGNLRDLLAGTASKPCDGGFPDATGDDELVGGICPGQG
jgi:hypothetical protein